MNKRKISIFNKLIILSITILFSFLFYLSIPALYNYESLQKQLNIELSNKFNLKVELSEKIKYRILPLPHFEIIDSNLYTNQKINPKIIGLLKNTKIFISTSKIYNQKKLKVENVHFVNSIFKFNNKNVNFLNETLFKKTSSNKIIIKKSKFFFKDNDETILIIPIKYFQFFYKNKRTANIVNINGLAFNSKFNLNLIKEFNDEKKINLNIKFPEASLIIQNSILKKNNNDKSTKVDSIIKFLGSELKTEINFSNNIVNFSSIKSQLFKKKIEYFGYVNLKHFYLMTELYVASWNWKKIFSNELINNDLFNKFQVHKNFNSKILININSFNQDKIFKKGKLVIETQNGSIKFDNSFFDFKEFGNIKFMRSNLIYKDGSNFIKSDISINLDNQKIFYNIFQVPKKFRRDLKKIDFNLDMNLSSGTAKISELVVNSKKNEDLSEKINLIFNNSDLKYDYNWIELKKFITLLVKEINLA